MSLFESPAKSILHPTDFSPSSESAFAHALAIAITNEAKLRILHVVDDPDEEVYWDEFPSVRETLERWGKLEPGSRRSEVARKLGINVRKSVDVEKDVARSILVTAEQQGIDLIVMATNEHRENPFWSASGYHTSYDVSKHTQIPTLFVPDGTRGCVSHEDGSTELNQVLIAVDHQPDAQPAIERIVGAMDRFGGADSQVTLLHVGESDKFPSVAPPEHGSSQWSTMTRNGSPSKEIVSVAMEINADLIVMVTEGEHGFWDALRGSTTVKVLKHAPCLVYAIPNDEYWDE